FDLHEFTPASLGHRHSISRMSKRLTPRETACLRARYCTDFTLEQIFQRELQNARITRRAEASERPRRASRAGRRSRCDRAEPLGKVEVRMVEEIEELRTKLQPVAFGESNVLEQRKAHDVRPRTFHDVAARSAERAELLRDEGAGVEPSVYSALAAGQVRIADQIGALIQLAGGRAIALDVDRERLPRLLGDDASRLPIAEYGVERLVPVLEWQVVGEIGSSKSPRCTRRRCCRCRTP